MNIEILTPEEENRRTEMAKEYLNELFKNKLYDDLKHEIRAALAAKKNLLSTYRGLSQNLKDSGRLSHSLEIGLKYAKNIETDSVREWISRFDDILNGKVK